LETEQKRAVFSGTQNFVPDVSTLRIGQPLPTAEHRAKAASILAFYMFFLALGGYTPYSARRAWLAGL